MSQGIHQPRVTSLVRQHLVVAGWRQAVSGSAEFIVEMDVETAVGKRTVYLYWHHGTKGGTLRASYISEGRNVVSHVHMSRLADDASATEVEERVSAFLDELRACVDGTYARGLHLRWEPGAGDVCGALRGAA